MLSYSRAEIYLPIGPHDPMYVHVCTPHHTTAAPAPATPGHGSSPSTTTQDTEDKSSTDNNVSADVTAASASAPPMLPDRLIDVPNVSTRDEELVVDAGIGTYPPFFTVILCWLREVFVRPH